MAQFCSVARNNEQAHETLTATNMLSDDAYAISGAQDTLVAVWQGDPSADRVNVLGDHLRLWAKRNAGRVYLYNVITATTRLPSAQARSALHAQFSSMRGQLQGLAIVMEKTGVEGSLSRAMLTTVFTVTRQPFPMRVFALRRDALIWLTRQGCTATADALTGVADTLTQRLRAQHDSVSADV
jgi:hypothetical protein